MRRMNRARSIGTAVQMLGVCLMTVAGARAQDTRTVTEPTFPAVCTVLNATQAIVSGAPASETTFDTSRIQSALTACASGKAVELAPSTDGTEYAYLSAPLNIPNGVSLIVDGGVTLFASRNPTDFQVSGNESCGGYGSGNGCNPFLMFNNISSNSGSGLYGYGVIDGRGGTTMLNGPNPGVKWWTNSDNAGTAGQSQDNPILVKPYKSSNFTIYKITLRNPPMFHVAASYVSGYTVWGVKIQAPFTAHNTDGLDETGTNISIINATISDGDDNIAVGASSASSNVTINGVTTYSGHGISVGSYTQGGLTNMLVENSNMAGTAADGNATGIRLKSAADRGGTLANITYENMCLRDTRHAIMLDPFYNTNSGTSYPWFKSVTLQNIHVLAPTGSTYPYLVQLQGYDASHITGLTMNNVVVESLTSANVTPASEYISIALAGDIYPSFLTSLTGTGVSYTGSASSNSIAGAYSCTVSSVFPYVVGDLYVSNTSTNNVQSVTVAAGNSFTLHAIVQPAMSQTSFSGTVGNYTGAAALTQPVSFYEGATLVGTGTLGANGTLASLTLSGVSTGTHTYTAQYPGDSNYGAYSFGSVTVTQQAPVTTTTGVGSSSSSVGYGTSVTLTATVTGTAGTAPTGTVQFYDGGVALSSAVTMSSPNSSAGTNSGALAVTLAAGSHSITAVYSGNTAYATSTSSATGVTVSKATLTLTATNVSRAYGQPNVLGYTLTGFVNSETQTSVTSGTPSITTTATRTSAVGGYTITAAVGTLVVSGNYSLTTVNGTLTVTGGVTHKIFFPALPNLASGHSYQLTARTNAGQTVTYSITQGGGLASVSGSTLTVTGVGTITVTANAAASNGFSAATAVSRTFTSH